MLSPNSEVEPMKKRVFIFAGLVLTAALLFSCVENGGNGSSGVNQTIDGAANEGNERSLVTKKELLQYILDNDVGITESDFEGIDIDDFIKLYSMTDRVMRMRNLKTMIEEYPWRKAFEDNLEIMAKEIVNVDSTDKEYKAFVDAFIKAVGEEFYFLGSFSDGLDGYNIVMENERHSIYIGKTKNIDQYDIKGGRNGVLEISLPSGDMYMTTNFCYSRDNKFFMFIAAGNIPREFEYELYRIFTEVRY